MHLTKNNIFFSVIFFFFLNFFIFSLLLYELYNTRNLLLLEMQKNEMLEKKLNQMILEIEHIKNIIKSDTLMDDKNLSFWQSCPDYSQNYLILAVIGLFTLFFIILTFIYLNSWWCGIPLINSSNEFISSINNLIAYINGNLTNYFNSFVPVLPVKSDEIYKNLYILQDYEILVYHKASMVDGMAQGVYVRHVSWDHYQSFNNFLLTFEEIIKAKLDNKILLEQMGGVETNLSQTLAQTIVSDPTLEAISFFGTDISSLI